MPNDDILIGAYLPDPSIRAIPTRYAGCHFRSRLEARWAVFFDALGIRWEYEPQGFEGWSDIPYLPDFLLPEVEFRKNGRGHGEAPDRPGVYVEVKPTHEQLRRDAPRIGACIDYGTTPISHAGLLILGPVPDPRISGTPLHSVLWWRKGVCHQRCGFVGRGERWWLLMAGDYEDDVVDGVADGIPCGCTPITAAAPGTIIAIPAIEAEIQAGERKLRRALEAARSARFEHGQSGAT